MAGSLQKRTLNLPFALHGGEVLSSPPKSTYTGSVLNQLFHLKIKRSSPDSFQFPNHRDVSTNGLLASPFFVSLILSLLFFLIRWNLDFSPLDEGYLWSGSDEVLRGKIPLLDFRSYDPGRYYWCALFAKIFGPGLLSIRLACSALQFLGLWWILRSARFLDGRQEIWLWGFLSALWMYPYFKIFEIVITLGTLALSFSLIQEKGLGPWLRAGLLVGVASFFGRNYALYSSISFATLWILRRIKSHDVTTKHLAAFLLPALIGLIPIAFLALLNPDFGWTWINTCRLVRSKGYFPFFPYPWPWMRDRVAMLSPDGSFGFSILFLILPFFYAMLMGLALFNRRLHAQTLGAVVTGLPLLHYIFSRADVAHLSVVFQPFLFCIAALSAHSKWKKCILYGCLLFSLWTIFPASGMKDYLFHKELWPVQVKLRSQPWRVSADTGQLINTLNRELQLVPSGENIAFLPYLPGLYPAFNLSSPLWDLYTGFYISEEEQNRTIRELESHRVTRVLLACQTFVSDRPTDYASIHPKTYRYLQNHYLVHRISTLDPYYYWLIRKDPLPPIPSNGPISPRNYQ
jgi:hypothetical protein